MDNLDKINFKKPSTKIDGKRYFIKEINDYTDGIELVVERLANLVGINCAHYDRVINNGHRYYLTEEIKNYMSAETFTMYKENLNDILDYINSNYPNKSAVIIDQIIKIFLFDIIILNGDRNSHNWGFSTRDDDVDVYILDNSCAFYGEEKVKLGLKEASYEIKIGLNDPVISQNVEELIYLLDTSSELYSDMFIDMLGVLTPENLKSTFDEVEEKYQLKIVHKDKLIEKYTNNYEIICNLFHLHTLRK